ncbi:winged helix-turn-helix domain-containing protein [Candidatus Bathyarchaeota archaeon]|nr:winged helix-turn-helix domain-containing protein [Candidatus Bathyarchaeota archaeon]
MGKHRNKLKIIVDILSIVRNGAKKTHIMYQGNLSFTLLSRYLNEVLTSGLVYQSDNKYLLTDAGSRFLDLFSDYKVNCDKVNLYTDRVESIRGILEEVLSGNVHLS